MEDQMKKVVVISSSPRKHSNSESLARAFAEGSAEAGNEVKFITLSGKTIGFCQDSSRHCWIV